MVIHSLHVYFSLDVLTYKKLLGQRVLNQIVWKWYQIHIYICKWTLPLYIRYPKGLASCNDYFLFCWVLREGSNIFKESFSLIIFLNVHSKNDSWTALAWANKVPYYFFIEGSWQVRGVMDQLPNRVGISYFLVREDPTPVESANFLLVDSSVEVFKLSFKLSWEKRGKWYASVYMLSNFTIRGIIL